MEIFVLIHFLYHHYLAVSRGNYGLVRRTLEHTDRTTEEVHQDSIDHKEYSYHSIRYPCDRDELQTYKDYGGHHKTAKQQGLVAFMMKADFISAFVMD